MIQQFAPVLVAEGIQMHFGKDGIATARPWKITQEVPDLDALRRAVEALGPHLPWETVWYVKPLPEPAPTVASAPIVGP